MPTYSKESLIAQIDQGRFFEYLLFYGHKESSDGVVSSSCCSQWYPAKFKVSGVTYRTAEQFMMAEKARLFSDVEYLSQILASKTPAEAKALGRKVRNFDERIWASNCSDIVVTGNKAKFSQNQNLARWLLDTDGSVLVEASPRDRIWGIGLGKSNPAALDPRQWRGKNLLGFALMQARDQLQ